MGTSSDRKAGRRPWEKELSAKAATMIKYTNPLCAIARQVVDVGRVKELEGKGWRRVD